MNKKKQTKRLSEQQIAELQAINNLPNYSKEKTQAIEKYAKKYKCSISNVRTNAYRYNETGDVIEKEPAKPKTGILTRNEFVIPVTNYELREQNGRLNLVVRF